MADKSVPQNNGGQYIATSSGNGETLIYTGTGRVCRVCITTAGTASFSLYDGTQSTGGTLIFTSLTNDALGTVKDIGMPFATGLVVKGTTGSAGICIGYNKDQAYGT